jgi:hypothetical protein
MRTLLTLLIVSLFVIAPVSAKMVVLFDEDNADEAGGGDFAGLFTSHDADSTVTVTSDTAFMGNVSVACTVSQSYNPDMGWSYSIDEYPYMTWAWKKEGGNGIMIQLAHDAAWAYRYVDVEDTPGWGSIILRDTLSTTWTLNTRNLVEDFGGGWNLTGMALTPYDGETAYYDLIVLHSEPNEVVAVEPAGKLTSIWASLKQ